MKARLYVNPGSHPCAAVEAALALKSIDYNRVDLLPLSQVAVGPLRYGGRTVPGLRLDGERMVGSRTIMRRLDELVPEPPLLPAPGDPHTHRCSRPSAGATRSFRSCRATSSTSRSCAAPAAMESYAGDAKLPLPRALMRPALPLTARLMALKNKANATLPRAPTSTRFQASWTGSTRGSPMACSAAIRQTPRICRSAATIRLLHTIADLRPLIDGRPAAR